jgi:transcriptional/translational regulatory protein YebC/TACO1
MSGHSKWSQIKRQKGVADARRGQIFTKLAREIIVAVRQGGPSLDNNFQLRLVVQKARDNNMPSDNIERAIKRGSGEAGEDLKAMGQAG